MAAHRRDILLAGGALPALAASGGIGARDTDAVRQVGDDLARYIGFGGKQAGGAGDLACGEWLAAELARSGYAVERQRFTAPFFEAARADIVCGAARASLWPQPIVTPTPADGVSAPLVRVDAAGRSDRPLAGAIALVELPHARHSSATAPAVRRPIEAAFAAGARAVVAITNGPTGGVIALNADGRRPMFAGPVALLAPRDAAPFFAGAQEARSATVTVTGEGGRRPSFNLVGRRDRGRPGWLVVSTPRSGWFTCGGERGPGVAAWLWLARWAARALDRVNLAFICNSGHEYEYLGAAEAMATLAPPRERTRFWLHLGANVAARDWHEVGSRLLPLPSADPQRFLSVSPEALPIAREVFKGLAGFETPYATTDLVAGELTEVVRAGYSPAAGTFGVHRYHHLAEDDARCVDAQAVAQAASAFQRLLTRML